MKKLFKHLEARCRHGNCIVFPSGNKMMPSEMREKEEKRYVFFSQCMPSHSELILLRSNRIALMMPSSRIYQLILCALVSQTIAHDMHSLKMSIMKGQLFQCANTTCPASASHTVPNERLCQIACLKEVSCQAASFQRSTSICELFAYVPNPNESISTNAEVITMLVMSGTRLPLGK